MSDSVFRQSGALGQRVSPVGSANVIRAHGFLGAARCVQYVTLHSLRMPQKGGAAISSLLKGDGLRAAHL